MHITFLGGVGTVTGSRYLLEHGGRRVLVDCGLFQGLKNLRLKNWEDFPVDPAAIDAVVLTHAHIDHSGYLPRLVTLGFRGKVHATAATRDLCALLLPDSGHLQEEEAEYLNRHGLSKHHPALPLYTERDGRRALERFQAHEFGHAFEPVPGVRVTFTPAGHILGAASATVRWDGQTILFSGDLGRSHDMLMRAPADPAEADFVVMESTYGDRLHENVDLLAQIAEIVTRTAARGGSVVIPAFAVGRAQALLFALSQLRKAHRIPQLPVFLDSPMATDATELYHHHRAEHRLDAQQCHDMCHVARIVNTAEESKGVSAQRFPSVIVSASGMATGGRVLHHLKAFLPDPRNTILFAGFQAAGTRGAALVGGARSVKIHGQYVDVRAQVANLAAFSAHADRDELLQWIGKLPRPPRRIFVTHGEPVAADSLRQAIEEKHGWDCRVPDYLARYDLR
jgi:metallo-beta-lactamase family protein